MTTTSLDTLSPGETATIFAIDAEHALHQRLGALGFRTGRRVAVVRQARFHGPLHVRIGSTDIILRRSEAHRIQVMKTPLAATC